MKILHAVGAMNRAGVETWLTHLAKARNRDRCDFDFLVHSNREFAYSDELRKASCRILPCPNPRNLPKHAIAFFHLVSRYGPYDVLHSHLQHFDGVMAALGRMAGIPMIISHSHNATVRFDRESSLSRRLYYLLSRYFTLTFSTKLAAVSDAAGRCRFGPNWQNRPNSLMLPSGIDTTQFALRNPELRATLGIADDATVIGHVGRFEEQKNHCFLIDVAREAARVDPTVVFVLVGEGPLLPEIRDRVAACGISKNVLFLGGRSDVPQLMTSVFDAFLFPSTYEGLGLVAIEAQAAGLPVVLSSRIPQEVDVSPELITRLPLDISAAAWAQAALSLAASKPVDSARALAQVMASQFEITNQIALLEELYLSAGHRRTSWQRYRSNRPYASHSSGNNSVKQ